MRNIFQTLLLCAQRRAQAPTIALVIPYLSDDWFEAAASAIASSTELRLASRGVQLTLQQSVIDGDETLVWHVHFADGDVGLHRGATPSPTVTFSCDRATAEDIRNGQHSAQTAFMAGRLRLGGDVRMLLDNSALLSSLNDALAPLRS
jgi:putative sterol carrier protein